MNDNDKKLKVNLCLGSSCFSRGSKNTLETLEEYIQCHGLQEQVELIGNLCQNKCKDGPNMSIDGKSYGHIDPASAIDILKHHVEKMHEM
jgi:NADH:ubiquinone oxidoreductase subunit E